MFRSNSKKLEREVETQKVNVSSLQVQLDDTIKRLNELDQHNQKLADHLEKALKENKTLREENKTLREESKKLKQKMVKEVQSALDKRHHDEISDAKIAECVDKLLKDPTINIYYLPDGVERQIYINIIKIIFILYNIIINQ